LKEPALNDQKQELGTDLQCLKEFDLDSEYGPCIGKYMLTFWLAGTCSKLSFICLLLLYLFSITLLAASYWYEAMKILIMLLQALQGLKDGNEQKSMDFTHQRKLKKSFYNIPTILHIRNGVCCLFLDKMNDLLTNKGSRVSDVVSAIWKALFST